LTGLKKLFKHGCEQASKDVNVSKNTDAKNKKNPVKTNTNKESSKPVVASQNGGKKDSDKLHGAKKVSDANTDKDSKKNKSKPVAAASNTKKPSKKVAKKADAEDDDILMGEEVGDEDIPDLSEFEDETSEEISIEVESLSSIDDGDDGEMTVEEAQAAVAAAALLTVNADEDDIILTDAEGRRLCRVRDCDQVANVENYCRYHYLMNWKRIQAKREILAGGKLERYVEELTSRYPDKFLDVLRKDLRTEKDFTAAIAELEIDESALENDFEDEAQSFIDEVRGVTEASSSISDDDEF
jgi:hypothetical protein